MREITVKGAKIVFYDDIKQMPIKRYQLSNKYLMINSDVGSDFADFDKRSIKIIEFLKKGMVDEAISEIENRRLTIWNAYKGYIPEGLGLAVMVYSIDGLIKDDLTDEGLEKTLGQMNKLGFTYNDMTHNISEVKKKSKFNLKRIFRIILRRLRKRSIMST